MAVSLLGSHVFELRKTVRGCFRAWSPRVPSLPSSRWASPWQPNWSGASSFTPPKKTQTCKPSDTQAAAPPPREEPPLTYICLSALYCLSTQCPHWDSNPEHKDFKSSVSANWTMGARTPHSSGHKHLLFHENAPEPKQKHISNGSPRSATAITTQKHRWATKPGSWRASGHKNGRCRRPKSSTPPFALSQVRYLREHTPKSGYFRALPSGVPVQYRLLPGMPGAGSAGGGSRRCRGRRSGSVPRWS